MATSDVDGESLLVAEKGEPLKATEHASHVQRHTYLYPRLASHPAIDRACLISDERSNTALLIAQDKVNGDLSKTVQDLNTAADKLGAALKVSVLCVAHVVGASDKTTAQQGFRHAYILVREQEVEEFYTPTFARAIRFLRASTA